MNRRTAIKTTLLGMTSPAVMTTATASPPALPNYRGNLKHSVCRWCFSGVPFEELCREVQAIGMQSIELTGPEEWKVQAKYGLTCAIGWGDYPKGINLDNFYADPKNHDALTVFYEDLLPKAAEAGIRNIICLSGRRDGRSDYENLTNCYSGIKRVIKTAERYGITLSMELLNSKVDHKDHQCDRTDWGVMLCEMVGSEHFKLLYDIYHMQIMEGDVIATIQKYSKYISHFHTAGVPGRHEINADAQELNYPAIMRAIVATGYRGFIGQEFIPTGATNAERFKALAEAVLLCDQ